MRMTKRFAAMALAAVMVLCVAPQATMAAGSSSGKLMKQYVTAYKAGKFSKAKKLSSKMKSTVVEPATKKMSKKMKKAYKAKVKSYVKKYGMFDVDSSSEYVWGYYLSDLNNDGKTELVISYGSCEADARMDVFTYKKGKAVKVNKETIACGHCTFHAYPNHKGMIVSQAHMGGESVSIMKMTEKGKIKITVLNSRSNLEEYTLPQMYLSGHISYDSNYNEKISYKVFK
ncbi:hypothetical protein [Eubacterium oxidoreducens]|uniref:Uncharacterized protein n=1 Tax=Eubacterium oxidoreducens TaxID=1732 RepID=A0A1G6BX55_EUBOX|nr:hypothetical protein [Eubacterium oxidoreducens]SDB25127.1 hypothetical protein SAMN02910417_01863 [Eubacterium oxidoreducens]